MTTAADAHADVPPLSDRYVVLDAADRVSYVSPGLQHDLGSWVGHVLWDHLPGAKDVYGPCFDEARGSGDVVERVVFYGGHMKRLTMIPAADGLAVHMEHLVTLDVTTLGTLAESLELIAETLGVRELGQRDPRALASLQAPP